MAVTYVSLARDYDLQVSTAANGTFVTVSGLNSMTFTKDTNTTDVTTFDSNGINVEMPVSMKLTLAFEGLQAFTDATLNTRDAGQSLLYSANTQLGNGSLLYLKVTHAVASGQLTVPAYVTLDEAGGGNDEKMLIVGRFDFTERPIGVGHFSKQVGSSS